jgi:hypothetical protein
MIDGSSVRQKRVGEKRPSFEELHDCLRGDLPVGFELLDALDNLLQVRTNVLNDELRETFVRWYLGMQTEQETEIERRPRSPVLKCSPIRAGAGAAAPPELSTLQPRGRRSAARTRKQ